MEAEVHVRSASEDFLDQSLDEIKLLKYINVNGDVDNNHVLRRRLSLTKSYPHALVSSSCVFNCLFVSCVCACVSETMHVVFGSGACVRSPEAFTIIFITRTGLPQAVASACTHFGSLKPYDLSRELGAGSKA